MRIRNLKHFLSGVLPSSPDKWMLMALVVLPLLVYLQVCRFELIDIDDFTMAESMMGRIQAGDNILLTFYRMPVNMLYWAPVPIFFYAIDVLVWGHNTHLYHLSNVVLHIANTLLLYFILRDITGNPGKSLLAALLFSVHPVNTGAVVFWGTRATLVGALFVLLTLRAYAWYARSPHNGRYGLVILFFLGALFSKPTLLYIPLLLIILDVWQFQRCFIPPSNQSSCYRKNIIASVFIEKLPILGIALIFFIFSVYFLHEGTYIGKDGFRYRSLVNLPLNAPVIYAGHLHKILIPLHLPLPHPKFPMQAPLLLSLISLIVLAGITIAVIRLARNYPCMATGWFWYLLAVSPYAVPLSLYNIDLTTRYMYIPSIGIFVMLVWGGAALLKTEKWGERQRLFAASLIVALAMASSFIQARKLQTEERYTRHRIQSEIRYAQNALRFNAVRNDAIAHHCLGTALEQNREYDKAMAQYRMALQLNPADYASMHNLAGILLKTGQIDQAIAFYQKALHINPMLYRTHNSLGTAYARKLSYGKAIHHFKKALAINPKYSTARANLQTLTPKMKNHPRY